MEKGLVITTGDHCLWKAVYAGNMAFADAEYARLREKYSGLTVTQYELPDAAFDAALVTDPMEII